MPPAVATMTLACKNFKNFTHFRTILSRNITSQTKGTLTSSFCMYLGHHHSSLGIENQGQRSRSSVRHSKDGNAVCVTSMDVQCLFFFEAKTCMQQTNRPTSNRQTAITNHILWTVIKSSERFSFKNMSRKWTGERSVGT